MKKCYIIFEYWNDISCDKTHEHNDKKYICGNPIRCGKIIRLVTTDKGLAITLTKHRPELSWQEEVLWTNLT